MSFTIEKYGGVPNQRVPTQDNMKTLYREERSEKRTES